MRVLVTGAAGFIGFHTAKALLERGDEVVGLDNLNDYYDPSLKVARLAQLQRFPAFRFARLDITDRSGIEKLFADERPRRVVHLAAQAGVRYSIINPHAYIQSNVVGFMHILEACRGGVEHLVYASTSSVYGASTASPYVESDCADQPLTLYAATKRANELMAHSYSSLFGLPTTGLRFFTVYGPWGRPDMALFLFTKNILADEPIEVFNEGRHERDFTYVDDVVRGIVAVLDHPATPDPAWSSDAPVPGSSKFPFRIYNVGNQRPVPLLRYIEILEQELGRKAKMKFLPLQLGDVPSTCADATALERDVGYRANTEVNSGVKRFVQWYLDYYHPRL